MEMVATTKLYEPKSMAEYNTAKTAFMRQIALDSEPLSIEEQWDLLISQFNKSTPHFEDRLTAFKETRKKINYSLFNMPVADCLAYFKDFYFLFLNDEPHFKLSTEEKKQLLQAIDDAIKTSEKGLRTRFEWILQQFRKAPDWVSNVLCKTRCNLLQRMQQDYSDTHKVDDALRIQVLNVMSELADEQGLGINLQHYFKDSYTAFTDKESITHYFLKQYPRLFITEYEEPVVDILCQHLLSEMVTLFGPVGINWETQPIIISEEMLHTFGRYLASRLSMPDIDAHSLGILDNKYPYTLKIKGACLGIIRVLIKQKLLNEGYLIPFEQITSENLAVANILKLRKNERLSSIIDFKEGLATYNGDNGSEIAQLMMRHTKTLLHYPELLLSQIENHPSLLLLLPQELKTNPCFLEQSIKLLDRLLVTALDSRDDRRINQLLSCLFRLTTEDSSFLSKLSIQLLNDRRIAYELVSIDGLLLRILPPVLKRDQDIVDQAIKQNPLAFLYTNHFINLNNQMMALAMRDMDMVGGIPGSRREYNKAVEQNYASLYNCLPVELQSDFPQSFQLTIANNARIAQLITCMRQIKAIHTLINAETLSSNSVIALTQALSPLLLIKIIKQRKALSLPPLPYCDDFTVVDSFYNALKEKDIDCWQEGYASVKKQACELNRVYFGYDETYEKSAVGYLARTDSWFIAMLQHQRYLTGSFKNWEQFWSQVLLALKTTAALVFSIAKLAVVGIAGISLAIFVNVLIAKLVPLTVFFGLLLFAVIGPLAASYIGNRALMGTTLALSLITSTIAALDVYIVTGTVIFYVYEGLKLPFLIKELINANITLLMRSIKYIFSSSDWKQTPLPDADLSRKCEDSIMRLKMIDNPSAQEKARVLETILKEINHDMREGLSKGTILPEQIESELARHLNVPYTMSYQGKRYQVSFYQIASIRRSNSMQFKIPEELPSPKLGFFSPSTMKMLPPCQFTDPLPAIAAH